MKQMDVTAEVTSSDTGVRLALRPGARAGAIPLRSAQTGNVAAGLLVEPRFGWAGVGRVLSQTGWHAGPEFIECPAVPGSGREIPPWVLAGPVLARFVDLLRTMKRGYRYAEEVLQRPRGRIVWSRYLAESLAVGRWSELPCRFPDLATDQRLRRFVKWALERVRLDLASAGGQDAVARMLLLVAEVLIRELHDVTALLPRSGEVERLGIGSNLLDNVMLRGLEALGWVVDERGLGGGREMDGLAWTLPLELMWEQYVESVVRRETALTGGQIRVGRKRETLFPIEWSDPSHRSLGHLVPDVVVIRGTRVHVIDAKYKAHLAELDDQGWHRFTDDARESHRADIHQILAYAALYSAEEVRATLIYPLRPSTFEALASRGRDRSVAQLMHGERCVLLELRGLPFGSVKGD